MHGLISKSSFVDWQDQPDFDHLRRAEADRFIFLADAGLAVLGRPPRLCPYYLQLARNASSTESSGAPLRCGSDSAGLLQSGLPIPALVVCWRYQRYRYNNSFVRAFNLQARNLSASGRNLLVHQTFRGACPDGGLRFRWGRILNGGEKSCTSLPMANESPWRLAEQPGLGPERRGGSGRARGRWRRSAETTGPSAGTRDQNLFCPLYIRKLPTVYIPRLSEARKRKSYGKSAESGTDPTGFP